MINSRQRTQEKLTKVRAGAITHLANLARGYATDEQCANALAREMELVAALKAAYDAMLLMRGMLSQHADISLDGGKLASTIEATGQLLYPSHE